MTDFLRWDWYVKNEDMKKETKNRLLIGDWLALIAELEGAKMAEELENLLIRRLEIFSFDAAQYREIKTKNCKWSQLPYLEAREIVVFFEQVFLQLLEHTTDGDKRTRYENARPKFIADIFQSTSSLHLPVNPLLSPGGLN